MDLTLTDCILNEDDPAKEYCPYFGIRPFASVRLEDVKKFKNKCWHACTTECDYKTKPHVPMIR